MEFSGKHHVDIIGLHSKADNEGKAEAYLDVELRISKSLGDAPGNEAFKALAESATARVTIADKAGDHEEQVVAKIQPTKYVVCSHHEVELDGRRWVSQPKLRALRPASAGVEVIAELRIPLDAPAGQIAKDALAYVGKTVEIQFNPKQQGFGFENVPPRDDAPKGKRGKKAKDTDAAQAH